MTVKATNGYAGGMTVGVGVLLLAGTMLAQDAGAASARSVAQPEAAATSDAAAVLASAAEVQPAALPPPPADRQAPVAPQATPASAAQVQAPQPAESAQTPAPPPERAYVPARSRQETVKARYLVQVMERVLESSVKYAATQMNYRLQAVSPDLIQLSGAARAHGFRLEGYGVFFDVEVPAALRQTMGWTFRSMVPNDRDVDQALTALRGMSRELDGKQRGEVDTALRLLELRVRPNPSPYTPQPGTNRDLQNVSATAVAAGDAARQGPSAPSAAAATSQTQAPTDRALAESPDLTYEMEVRDALVGAMLEYGNTLTLQPDEWLTIAARDNQTVIVPGDLSETVTVVLRIKGSDLADYKAGRLDEAAARSRVEVREF